MHHVVAIGVGSSVGVSIFGVLSPAAALAGPGLLVSLALAAIPMALFAFTYAFMSAAVPASGASFAWPSRFIGPFTGFLIAWLRIVGSTAAIVQHGVVLIRYVDAGTSLQLPTQAIMIGLFSLFYIVNVVGVSAAAKAQTFLTILLVGLLLVYAVTGMPHVQQAHLEPFAPMGWTGIVLAIPVLVGLFIGVEFAAEMGEEIRDIGRVIAPGLAISVICVLLLYGLVGYVTLGVAGAHGTASSEAPLLDAARGFLGQWAYPVVSVAAILAIATSLNGVLLIFSRYLFAMGRAGVLPAALGRVHPRRGTPHVAMTVVYMLSIAGTFMPNDLLFLFLAVNIPTMLKYGACSLSAVMLVRRHPSLHAAAQFRPTPRLILFFASLGMMCALAIGLIGAGADWRPYALLGGWALVGVVVWQFRKDVQPIT